MTYHDEVTDEPRAQ